MKSVDVVVNEVLVGLADVNENGEVTAFDYDGLSEVIKQLQAKKKEMSDMAKEAKKAEKDATNAANAEVGKTYYDSLKIGERFTYKDSQGEIHSVTKIATKSNSGLSAACEIDASELKPGKTKRARYPKFYQVIVPADFAQVA